MQNMFICSLCCNGMLGGALYVSDGALTFRTNKLTVDAKYRNLELSRDQITAITWKGILASVQMENGDVYKFLIFNKNRFLKFI